MTELQISPNKRTLYNLKNVSKIEKNTNPMTIHQLATRLRLFKCNKFIPNQFNRQKCQSCFASREAHSAQALEAAKMDRRVMRCGYLFVAPDGMEMTEVIGKRWQRRFFVLYDDGELTYSIDQSPGTIPQCSFDMRKCTGVEYLAEPQYSLCISVNKIGATSTSTVFIKADNSEEIRRWYEVLCKFTKSSMQKPMSRSVSMPEKDDTPPRYSSTVVHVRAPSKISQKSEKANANKNYDEACNHFSQRDVKKRSNASDAPAERRLSHQRLNDTVRIKYMSAPSMDSIDVTSQLSQTSDHSKLDFMQHTLRKGWLSLKLTPTQWQKHWVVLSGLKLRLYVDAFCEERHELPFLTIDLGDGTTVQPISVTRNYGIEIRGHNQQILSAPTPGIRDSWIEAMINNIQNPSPMGSESDVDRDTANCVNAHRTVTPTNRKMHIAHVAPLSHQSSKTHFGQDEQHSVSSGEQLSQSAISDGSIDILTTVDSDSTAGDQLTDDGRHSPSIRSVTITDGNGAPLHHIHHEPLDQIRHSLSPMPQSNDSDSTEVESLKRELREARERLAESTSDIQSMKNGFQSTQNQNNIVNQNGGGSRIAMAPISGRKSYAPSPPSTASNVVSPRSAAMLYTRAASGSPVLQRQYATPKCSAFTQTVPEQRKTKTVSVITNERESNHTLMANQKLANLQSRLRQHLGEATISGGTLDEQIHDLEQTADRLINQHRDLMMKSMQSNQAATINKNKQQCNDCQQLKMRFDNFARDHQVAIANLKDQIQKWRKRAELNEQANLQHELQDLENELLEFQTLRAQHDQRIKELESQLDDSEKFRLMLQDDMKNMKVHNDSTFLRLQESQSQMLTKLKEHYDTQLKKLKSDHDQELEEEKDATKRALDAVQRSHAEELKKLKLLQQNRNEPNDDDVTKLNDTIDRLSTELGELSAAYSAKCCENAALQEKIQENHRRLNKTTNSVLARTVSHDTNLEQNNNKDSRQSNIHEQSSSIEQRPTCNSSMDDRRPTDDNRNDIISTQLNQDERGRSKTTNRRSDIRYHSNPSRTFLTKTQNPFTTRNQFKAALAVPVSQRRRFFEPLDSTNF